MRTVTALVVALAFVVAAASGAGADVRTTPTTTLSSQSTPAPAPSPSPVSDADSVDVLEASRDEVMAGVAGLNARLHEAEQAASAAQAKVDEANAAAMVSAAKAQDAQERAEAATEEVRSYAVEAFVRPPSQDALSVLAISETRDAAYATDVLTIVAEQRRQVVDTMVAAKAVAESDRQKAESALVAARAEVASANSQVEELRSARAQQARLAARLDDRLDAKLAEAAALKSVDAGVADVMTAQEVTLRTSGPQSTVPGTVTPGGSRPLATTASAGGGSSAPAPTPTPTAPPVTGTPRPTPTTVPPTSPPVSVPGLVTWADVTKVGGIWVNKSVAGQVGSLLAAARSAGINLSGGGFRDPASQIALRTAHCGTSTYAIYQMPASQCSPPTARPGTSMHERGLALDLQSSGRLITSRSDPAFAWLAANAPRYGFHNLPSEPWHWSTTGS